MSNLKCAISTIQRELENITTRDDYAHWVHCYGQLLIDWVNSTLEECDELKRTNNSAMAAISEIACCKCKRHNTTDLLQSAKVECVVCMREKMDMLEKAVGMIDNNGKIYNLLDSDV